MFGLFGSQTSADNTELKDAVKAGAFLVDVRSPGEFYGGSVMGAVNIPVEHISDQLDEFKGKENIVVFCRSGARSGQAKSILEHSGLKNVINGGTWQNVNNVVNNS